MSHVLLSSIPHIFNTESKNAYVFNYISFIITIISFYFLIKLLFRNCKVENQNNLTLFSASLYAVNILFLTFDNKPELLFCTWLNLSYTLGLALFIIGLVFYLKEKFVIASILFLFFAFNKINIAFEGLIILIIIWFNTLKHLGFRSFYPLSIFTISLIANIAAPGNEIRHNLILNEISIKTDSSIILYNNLLYYSSSFFKALGYSGLLILPIVKLFFSKVRINLKSSVVLYYILVAIFFIIFESLFFAFTFKEAGPSRTKIFLECYALFGAILFSLIIRFEESLSNYILVLSLFLVTIFENIKLFKYIPVSNAYSKSIDERDSIMKHALNSATKNVQFNHVPASGILNSAYENDEEWLNNVYRRYYTNDSTYHIQVINCK